MINTNLFSVTFLSIHEDAIINFDFVLRYLGYIYNSLNGLWDFLASSYESEVYETMVELGMSEDIAQGIQDAISSSFFASWSPLTIALGLSIPALATLEIIKYFKSLLI